MTTKSVFADDLAASIGLRDFFPQDEEEGQRAEQALANELRKLSLQEQEKVLLDMHGVSVNAPSDNVIAAKLEEMDRHLSLIPDKPAYDRAKQLDRAYVEDKARRLSFLRTEHFEAKDAATMMVLHFQVKQDLFVGNSDNDEILVRSVTWDDLREEDRLCVMKGYWQICPQRDIAGRTIVFVIPSLIHNANVSTEAKCRSIWYFLMSALASDREMREKGTILVILNFGNKIIPSHDVKKVVVTFRSIPMLKIAGHYCYQNPLLRPVVTGYRLLLFLRNDRRIRLQTHFGNVESAMFKLRTFGIPVESCPLKRSESGDSIEVAVGWHLHWLDTIRVLEPKRKKNDATTSQHAESLVSLTSATAEQGITNPSARDAIIIPRRFDVLFGKTKFAMQHTGTVRCQHIVRMHYEVYNKANKRKKGEIVNRILALIHESKGRFLRWDEQTSTSGFWMEADTEAARNKISHFFRRLRSDLSVEGDASASAGGTTACKRRSPS